MDLNYYLNRTDKALHNFLPTLKTPPIQLHQAMHYAIFNGGKRIRAILCYLSGKIFSIPENQLDIIAAALECVHAYSLVHDDLPDMDDAPLRRGQPSCHKAFNNATAILAGDALQTQAFIILSEEGQKQNITDKQITYLVKALALAIGSKGMAGGQMFDLNLTDHFFTPNIENIVITYRLKTAALIKASLTMPLYLANLNSFSFNNLANMAEQLGIAFQIQDDILDITQSSELLGKTAGIDEKNNKITYAHLQGLENARQEVDKIFEECLNILKKYGSGATLLIQYIESLAQRQN